jgi:hypothetical protein
MLSALSDEPQVDEGERLYIRWIAPPDDTNAANIARDIATAGAVPWIVLDFRSATPLADHLETLTAEIDAAARMAESSPPSTHFQIGWSGGAISDAPEDYAFLLKRASVALKGVRDTTRVLTASIPADPGLVDALYAEDPAVYLDGVVLSNPAPAALEATLSRLIDLDPGKPVVVDGRPLPTDPAMALTIAAQDAAAGVAVTLFDDDGRTLSATDLEPFKVLAREFAGDLAYDRYSSPDGAHGAWSFVRGTDLGLRVIVDRGSSNDGPWITFSDGSLKEPMMVTMDGSEEKVFGQRSAAGLRLPAVAADPVVIMRLERPSAGDLGGFEERLDVDETWQMPVEEVLRRLQATEDAQRRRLRHYEATYTQHLRYRPGEGLSPIEATFTGPFFFRQGQGFDWVWEDFYVQGVRWKGRIPELPLIQPAKAAERPLEITFDRSYRYSLRGTTQVSGRDCWVVDFEPAAGNGDGQRLWRGTVWVDRQVYARVRTRALQIGLAGDVLSNEETQDFSPVDATGAATDWTDSNAFVLPLRVEGQEVQSILNNPVQVEKESLLENVRINADGFGDRIETAYASDETMLRDTDQGLRYLEKSDDGDRVVREGFDTSKWFLLGGTYYDKGLDFPLPLAGVNYFDNDFRGTGNQVNLFFAGVLFNANWADPDLFGSRWDAGARLFGFVLPRTQELYRDGIESTTESVDTQTGRLALFLGHPIGSYAKVDLTYGADWDGYDSASDTAGDFVVPQSTFTQSLGLKLTYSRKGWRFAASGKTAHRADWEFWGFPGNTEYDGSQRGYEQWQASVTKTWWLGNFLKLGVQVEHLGGADLDRFSKYDFSFFGDSSIAGYQGGLVTASEADAVHIDYGFNLGEVIRFGVRGDAAWATDNATGLDRELLAGVSLNGTVIGPWQTVVNFDVGVPVAGPADGVTVSLVFLKLFD